MSGGASDLPQDLLSLVADELGLIDLLSFRAVCRNWRSASTWSTAAVESMHGYPWLLIYGEDSPICILQSRGNMGITYKLRFEELDGAICMASIEGWLLLFNKGSMFFFCPFSRTRIDLPNYHLSELPESYVATFSSAPTRHDCIVAVATKNNAKSSSKLEVRLLFRGYKEWLEYEYETCSGELDMAIYHNGVFHIFHDSSKLLTFISVDGEVTWKVYLLLTVSKSTESKCDESWLADKKPVKYITWKMEKVLLSFINRMKNNFGSDSSSITWSISTCGTKFGVQNDPTQCGVIYKEKKVFPPLDPQEGCDSRTCNLKAVWIQPRYFQVSPHQTW
ncbi:F-box protein At3g56470-like [Arachis stenosperma]|uniref:F-box protein At3g56470-like n=1 Tax=Arachis stenosperma TaxID=217475 RepID=UPI0025ABF0C2|nr:F-box protein At3g56470-like [Arachis stenosperma]